MVKKKQGLDTIGAPVMLTSPLCGGVAVLDNTDQDSFSISQSGSLMANSLVIFTDF